MYAKFIGSPYAGMSGDENMRLTISVSEEKHEVIADVGGVSFHHEHHFAHTNLGSYALSKEEYDRLSEMLLKKKPL